LTCSGSGAIGYEGTVFGGNEADDGQTVRQAAFNDERLTVNGETAERPAALEERRDTE
jgi:hypothetical protein